MSKISPNELGIGSVFRYLGKVHKLIGKEHVKLSKGGACIKARCYNMETGSVVDDLRLNVNDTVERIFVEKLALNYQYSDGEFAYFMNDDGESFEIKLDNLKDIGVIFGSDSEIVDMPKIEISQIRYKVDGKKNYDEEVVKIAEIKLLSDILVQIQETRPSIKGQTAKANLKEAKTKGGFKVNVPQYIADNDLIYVNYDEEEGFKFKRKHESK